MAMIAKKWKNMAMSKRIRVLIVDDSAIARDILEKGLSNFPDIEVVGKASDAWSARDRIVFLDPDVITLDILMPKMDGIEFLKRLLPQYPLPVVIVSSVTGSGSIHAIEALDAGAVGVVAKPDAQDKNGLRVMIDTLAQEIRQAAVADIRKARKPLRQIHQADSRRNRIQVEPSSRLIAIGASTGGTAVLNTIIPLLSINIPPVVIVQHMPPVFTRLFAEALDKMSAVTVREASHGERVLPGQVLIAPGDFHMSIKRDASGWTIFLSQEEKVNGHRPSVDTLFYSVAREAGSKAIGLLLTGMGKDGAQGLLHMRRAGARCFSQNSESSVVYGMPKEAWEIGASEKELSIEQMPAALMSSVHTSTVANYERE